MIVRFNGSMYVYDIHRNLARMYQTGENLSFQYLYDVLADMRDVRRPGRDIVFWREERHAAEHLNDQYHT